MRATERIEHAKDLLDEIGIGGDRIQMYYVGASDAPIWAERVSEFTERIKSLGPNPLRQVREEKQAAND